MLVIARFISFIFLLIVALFKPFGNHAAAKSHEGEILIICSYNPAAHQTSVTISDFMDEYRKLGGKRDIVIENMNCKSFSEAPLWKGILKQILSKYQGQETPGQVVLLGQEAWAAYLTLKRDSLAMNLPVMCSLVSSNVVMLPEDTTSLSTWMPQSLDLFQDRLNIPELKSGFVSQYDIDGNIRMITALYPQTRHIAFISDNTYGGVTMQALVRKEMKKYPDLDLILLDGRQHSIYTIVDELRRLPDHTVLLVGTWRVDKNEGYFMRNATYAMMEANPKLPAFTPSSVGLGYWAIGGVIPEYRALGKEMAQESRKMELQAEDTTNHISVIPSEAVIDHKLMKEWSIDLHNLPFNVKIINQPFSFYQQHKYKIWIGFSMVVLLALGFCFTLFYYLRAKRLTNKLLVSEKDLRIAKERAEEANHLKSAFLANMSHEIRTPLNSIVGFSDVLASGESTPEDNQNYYGIIKTNSDLLLRLINDILDISRLEAGKVMLTWENCDVILLCRQIVASVSVSRKSGNKFLFESQYEHFELYTDIQRLQQVIINLLSNADKFTKQGTITLNFRVEQERALFSVTDTGCGIPKEKQGLVFERFEKLNEYAQGTGLGLSICKLIVHKWEGNIWIDSEYTGGARFVFSHPLNKQDIEK